MKFYKETGKWYDECVIEIQDDFVLDSDDFKRLLLIIKLHYLMVGKEGIML